MNANYVARRPLMAGAVAALLVGGGIYAVRGSSAIRNEALAGEAAGQTAPAVPVTVRTLAEQKVRIWAKFSGRLQAVDAAEIRPEVGGRITEVLFEDGQTVKAGDVLFVIDPRPYEAATARAEANLASARTNAAFAKLDRERADALIGSHTMTQRDFDQRGNASRVADAAVQTAEAELKLKNLAPSRSGGRRGRSGRSACWYPPDSLQFVARCTQHASSRAPSFPARRRSGERLRLRPYFPSEVARLFAFAGRSCS
jgi:multidrug efflux system membrane fusion protein